MNKAIVMLLLAASGAQAQEGSDMAEILGERAALQEVGHDDAAALDATTLGKGEKKVAAARVSRGGGGGGRGGNTVPNGGVGSQSRQNMVNPRTGKRVFGGTTKLMAGEGKPIQQAPKAPGFWGAGEFTGIADPKKARPKVGDKDERGRRIFGGTTKLLAGEGKPIWEQPKVPGFWGGGGRDTKSKAFSAPKQVAPPKGLRAGSMIPRVRAAPFALAGDDQFPHGDAIFAGFAFCMLLSTVVAMLRSRPKGREVLLQA